MGVKFALKVKKILKIKISCKKTNGTAKCPKIRKTNTSKPILRAPGEGTHGCPNETPTTNPPVQGDDWF